MKGLLLIMALSALPAQAATWDNEAGIYTLPLLPSAGAEALRLDTDEREDQQPLGRMAQRGEILTVTLIGLPPGAKARLTIGFRPFWGVAEDQQIEPLDEGMTEVTATQDGPVFLQLTGAGDDIAVRLTGGKALPLFVDGAMSAGDWRAELAAHPRADFIQLIGDHALITLTADAYRRDPVPDPAASLAMIDQVLGLEDDLSGLDGAEPLDAPTPLRQHFIVDFRVSADARQNFYMYATDGFIGMLPDNTGDLTNPGKLAQEWAIWHETGHIHQPYSWTWGSATEITVNIWSLYVQEALGHSSRLAATDEGKSIRAQARDYLGRAGGPPDFLIDDDDTVFIRLVMFEQLARIYGWDLFRSLNRATRSDPLLPDATDQDKVDYLVRKICLITGEDLRPFFTRWNLIASTTVLDDIGQMGLPLPAKDPSRLF
jgi:Peptidase M60, enhancin and enhancin-like